MQLDKLQIGLRPRTNAQALDLGLALLRAHAGSVYKSWLALWLPVVAICAVLTWSFPASMGAWLLLAWWFRPMFERAPLYVLSRQVFGEAVTWQQAVRAWPRQLGGGSLRLLTWGRLFAAGRGIYQPIWLLEHARGKVARERCKVLGKNQTAHSAFWFGVACAHFEGVLQLGLLAFAGLFASEDGLANPLVFLFAGNDKDAALYTALVFASYALAAGIIAPVYTACCFTLYLNRRASLEAWDIEIALRQITPPPARARKQAAAALPMLVGPVLLLALVVLQPAPAQARTASAQCEPPEPWSLRSAQRSPERSAAQAALRAEVDRIFDGNDLRGYKCVEVWEMKERPAAKPGNQFDPPSLDSLAHHLKVFFIAAALGTVGWLLYRYRGELRSLGGFGRAARATEVGGLDIRAESLPTDVAASVHALWAGGEYRAALGLLYRATLSRLVNDDGLVLRAGATEGDCLRLSQQACARHRLSGARLQVVATATALWLNGAYGSRWPDTDTVAASCTAWKAEFDQAKARLP
jgi:hypothetical protein